MLKYLLLPSLLLSLFGTFTQQSQNLDLAEND